MWEMLKQFTLKHHDLPTMVRNVAVLLRVLALDIDSRNTTRVHPLTYLTTVITIGLYIYSFPVSLFWLIFWRGAELLVSILLFTLAISSLIGVIKLMYMYFHSKNLKKLVSEYLKCDSTVIPGSRMSRNIQTTLRQVKKRAMIFWILIISNGIVYVVMPIFIPGRHLPEDQKILLGLEPKFESPYFELTYFAECVGVFLSVYAPASITGFIIVLVGYSEAQMLALSQELLHLWDDAQNYYQQISGNNLQTNNDNSNTGSEHSTENFEGINMNKLVSDDKAYKKRKSKAVFELLETEATSVYPTQNYKRHINDSKEKITIINDYILHRLISIMRIHATNVNLVKDIRTILQNALVVEFILLFGGLVADLLGGLENTYIAVPFAMVQVSMDCITGQRLQDANKAFEEAVYSCNWENFNVNNMKLVMVMLQNAQKVMRLSAGGVTDLSYTTLMSVIRSVYSTYTALRSTMNT